jgi:hypothetical protein
MEVEDALAAIADACLDRWLLDVHVEGVEQQTEIGRPHTPDKLHTSATVWMISSRSG